MMYRYFYSLLTVTVDLHHLMICLPTESIENSEDHSYSRLFYCLFSLLLISHLTLERLGALLYQIQNDV
jgi:hypothetical protein